MLKYRRKTNESEGETVILVHPSMIPEIDKYASETLGIPTATLMHRAGSAVARAVRSYAPKGTSVAIFAGKGNNGGDGYAAAVELFDEYKVTVYDVFSVGQRTDEGKRFLKMYHDLGGTVVPLTLDEKEVEHISSSGCLVDAVFGTGYSGDLPEIARRLIELFATLHDTVKIAVDVPLGVNSELGTLTTDNPYYATATVALGFVKVGLVSYPAGNYVGRLIIDNLGLQNERVLSRFSFDSYYTDSHIATETLPERASDSHKGSYGKLLMVAGSSTYLGAAHLSLEAALRSGVGYVTYLGEKAMCDSLVSKLPEAIYTPVAPEYITSDELAEIAQKHTAILIGSGIGTEHSDTLYAHLEKLLLTDGAPLILDADAINVLAKRRERSLELIRASLRKVVLTPHPLEFSRLSGIPTSEVQSNRLAVAKSFAKDNDCILVLKGAGTVITDGNENYINSTGSSALAKAGSGDVLAGCLAAFVASGVSPLRASALAAYLHGLAADSLSEELSEFGVIPSDLPREIARQIRKIEQKKVNK